MDHNYVEERAQFYSVKQKFRPQQFPENKFMMKIFFNYNELKDAVNTNMKVDPNYFLDPSNKEHPKPKTPPVKKSRKVKMVKIVE